MDLVTGAGGFLGRALVGRLVADGVAVRAMLHRGGDPPAGAEPVRAALEDADSLRRAATGCATVFHLAARVHDPGAREDAFQAANVGGTASLLAAARDAGAAAFVFVSSVKAMGEGGDACLDEDAPAVPVSPYGRSKLEAEELVRAAGAHGGLRVSILRLPLVYGAGLKGNLSAMLDAVARGLFPPLPRVPNRRSLASVADAVNACVLAARNPAAAGRTYLVTDGAAYSSREIYDDMREALGKPPVRWSVPLGALRAAAAAGDALAPLSGGRAVFGRDALAKLLGSAWYANVRIRKELGFAPATTLRAALPEIVAARRRAR